MVLDGPPFSPCEWPYTVVQVHYLEQYFLYRLKKIYYHTTNGQIFITFYFYYGQCGLINPINYSYAYILFIKEMCDNSFLTDIK